MKVAKRLHNVSDTNDREICNFKLIELREYVTGLKKYLASQKNKLKIAEYRAISVEIEAWVGFFRMIDKLNLKSKRRTIEE